MLPRLPVPIARSIQKLLDEKPIKDPEGETVKWEQRSATEDKSGGRDKDSRLSREDRSGRDDRVPPPRDDRDEGRTLTSYKDLDAPSVPQKGRDEGRPGGYERRDDYRRDERRDDRRDDRVRDDFRRDEPRDRRDDGRRDYERADARRDYHGNRDDRRTDGRGDRRDYLDGGSGGAHDRRPVHPELNRHDGGGGGRHADDRRHEATTVGREDASSRQHGREPPAREDANSKRSRPDVPAAAAGPPAKHETAAEKLARLRAKQAERGGAFTARIGGDYSGNVNAAPAKGLQRYQQLLREGRE